jgi:NAD(P)-dependent dehydrogenase (short-subunit alcohol dehydrogenase family)
LKERSDIVRIAGSTAVVTGGQRGLGAAFVDELLSRGATKIYATSRTPQTSGNSLVVRLPLDVTDALSVSSLAAAAKDADIVVNNAGVVGGKSLLRSDLEEIRAVFETNYFGALRVARAFAPVLARNGGGALVDIHSVLSWAPGTAAYGDSKAALWSATNSMRIELRPQKTLVVGVYLSYTDTDMVRRVKGPKNDPRDVARKVLDAVEQGQNEVLADPFTEQVKATLSKPVEAMEELMDRARTARLQSGSP